MMAVVVTNWSYKMSSQIAITNKPTSSFPQAGCPSCRPTNSVKALKGTIKTSTQYRFFCCCLIEALGTMFAHASVTKQY